MKEKHFQLLILGPLKRTRGIIMINSIFFLAAFALLLGSLILFPKTKRKLGFIQELTTGFLFVLCYGAIGAGAVNFVKLPVNLCTMGVIYAIPAVFFIIGILLKKKVQRLTINRVEVISVIILSAIFVLIELKVFSFEMRAAYDYNTDAGNHLHEALSVVRTQKVNGMYFASLFNGLFIDLLKPFLEEIKYYKGFVLADNIHYYFELIFYYAVIFSVAKKKHTKYFAPVFALLLFAGYPLYSYIEGHYVYWGWGAVLLCFIIYELEQYIEYADSLVYSAVKITFGFVGVVLCYSLFAPLAAAAIAVVGGIEMKKRKVKISKKVWIGMAGICLVCIAAAGYLFYSYFYRRGLTILDGLKTEGSCYTNLITDFVWILPVIVLFFYYCIKKRIRLHVYGTVYIVFVSIQVFALAAFFAGQMSAYYYYKLYYPLWILTWVLVALAVDTISVEKNELKYIYIYAIMTGVVYISCFGRIPELLNSTKAGWISDESSLGNHLYSRNAATLGKNFEDSKYSTAQFEICEYVMENFRDKGENVLFVGWWDCRGQSNWYTAITDMGSLTYRMLQTEGDSWKKILDLKHVKYYVVLKTSDLYKENMDYFDEQNWIFENEEGFIVAKTDSI